MLKSLTALFWTLWLLPFVTLAEDAPPVHEFVLDNGLKVLVKEDHRAPVVVSRPPSAAASKK